MSHMNAVITNEQGLITDPEVITNMLEEVAMGLSPDLQVPPPVFHFMQGQVLEYMPKQWLKASFPVLPEYNNPVSRMQGGLISAAIDNTLGPLAFLVCRAPSVTLSMHLDYIRGIGPGENLIVKAGVVSRSRSNLVLEAEALNERSKLIARASAQFQTIKMR